MVSIVQGRRDGIYSSDILWEKAIRSGGTIALRL